MARSRIGSSSGRQLPGGRAQTAHFFNREAPLHNSHYVFLCLALHSCVYEVDYIAAQGVMGPESVIATL